MVGHTGFMLGIVAAVMAIIMAYVKLSQTAIATLTLFSLSLGVFLLAAEQFSEAVDFEDRRRHLRAIKLYNLGVVLMLWGLGMLMLIFSYWLPTGVLLAFSLYWIRDVMRTIRPPIRRRMIAGQTDQDASESERN
jgi:hypothetical protein